MLCGCIVQSVGKDYTSSNVQAHWHTLDFINVTYVCNTRITAMGWDQEKCVAGNIQQ